MKSDSCSWVLEQKDSHIRHSLIQQAPLVSCIMPTADRRRFVPQAIGYFLRQDYPNKELVILDDGGDAVADLIPAHPQIRYERLTGQRTLGAKRNQCVEASRGDLILHWDDDDWMASWRIRYQVEHLLAANGEICGLRRMFFYEFATDTPWLYQYPERARPWLAGGSLLYTRAFWQRSPFPNVQVGSDTRFVWSRQLAGAVELTDHRFYVAMIHPRNTSRKVCRGAYWSRWAGSLAEVMGEDLHFYNTLTQPSAPENRHKESQVGPKRQAGKEIQGREGEVNGRKGADVEEEYGQIAEECGQPSANSAQPATYSIIMVVHNALPVVQVAITRTLRHSAGEDARLLVVDNGSNDGVEQWLDLLARRGDIDLIRNAKNIGHGPALEVARRATQSPYLVALDSDAFPICDGWLSQLRARLVGSVKITGILHHRNYIHPSCLMIERETMEKLNLSFLNEKDQPSRFDVAERMSHEILRLGGEIAGLERTDALRRGSISEPVYLGVVYADLVYHQWYTTRTATANGRQVDDVPPLAIKDSLAKLLADAHAESRPLTVIMGLQVTPNEPQRLRNALAALQALNLQDLPRWRYRIILVEQGETPRAQQEVAPFVDRYLFAFNPGAYNRGWGFNVGAALPASRQGALCLIDADLLAPPDFLRRGLAEVEAGRLALQPYSEILYLNAEASQRAIVDRLSAPLLSAPLQSLDPQRYQGERYTTSQGGCIWVDAQLYQRIGGHNEAFRGWGQEDREFWERLAQATPIHQLPGTLLHLDHPRPAMNDQLALANRQLRRRLNSAGQIQPTQDQPAQDQPAQDQPAQPMGDPERYRSRQELASHPSGAIGRREWEQWHRWNRRRLEMIVKNERRQQDASVRGQLADALAKRGDSLLDVGCGPGALWPHLERYQPRLTWAGVDATAEMVETARRLFAQTPIYHADAGELPFADAAFDVVLLRHLLEYLPDWLMREAIQEATRVARRTVVLAFYIPPASEQSRQSNRVGEGFVETRWTVADVEEPVHQCGWRVEERFSLVGSNQERDDVWILTPRETGGRSQRSATAEPFKFSIIMPTFRRGHTLLRTVQMIQHQRYQNWELIIVDNAGDVDLKIEDPRVRVYRHTGEASASYARNQGLRYVTGDLVCFFDDDDDMFPDYLADFAAAFQAHPGAKMVRCGMIVSTGQTNYSYATPECCLRARFAAPIWSNHGPGQDQRYFRQIIATEGWREERGEIVVVRRALCRANADPRGGLRSGGY